MTTDHQISDTQQTVFVVDDDPDFAEGVAITLEIEGHEVTLASSGREAVDTLQNQDFDITLMDVRMPGMNGIESLLKIREIKPDAKVIMMTAYTVEELMNQAVDEGALGVLHKPVDSEILLKTLLDATRTGVVLVADDDPDFAEGMETSLTNAGRPLANASQTTFGSPSNKEGRISAS